MRASIVIATHNEGDCLLKTVESVREIADLLECEIVVADDASTDGSIEELRRRAGEVRIVAHDQRRGTSPTKDLGARAAQGDVLIFLDAHTKPEDGAILGLIMDVEELQGEAIVAPRVLILDAKRWENLPACAGYGYRVDLPELDGRWVMRKELKPWGRFYESPGLCGCCFAISRRLYEKLRGFDPDMFEWGLEDLDLGIKAWLMGHPVLNDPLAAIGHRFNARFPYAVAIERVFANRTRIARKAFSDRTFEEWLRWQSSRVDQGFWERVLAAYKEREKSVEAEKEYLHRLRPHDEFWFASRFGCGWLTAPQGR